MVGSSVSRLAQRVGMAGVVIALFVLSAEALVRVLLPQPISVVSPGLYKPDPPRRYRLRPGHQGSLSNGAEFSTHVAINSLGLRGPESRRQATQPRILVLGDSFVFGWGVEIEASMVAGVQLGLRQDYSELEVLNGGLPGFGLRDEVDWLRHHGLRLEPDLVVLVVMMGNDLLEATANRRRERLSEILPEAGIAGELQITAYRRSHLFRLTKRAGSGLASRLGLPEPWAIGYLREMMGALALEPPLLVLEGRQASRQAVAELVELAEDHGIALAALLIPAQMQVQPEVFEALCALIDLEPSEHDPDVPGRFFAGLLAEHNIPNFDVSAAFRREIAKGEQLYFAYDPHWTPAGHDLAADLLVDFLVAEHLVPIS